MKVQSDVTGKCYDPKECVFILNPLQVYKYLVNNAEILDVLPGEDNKLVYCFSRENTKKLYDAWCKHEL